MKQFDPVEKTIGEYTFYIRPLPAFKASKLSGELVALVAPLVGGLAPLLGDTKDDAASIFDVDVTEAAPAIAGAFSALSGDKLEKLMKALLTEYRTIAYQGPEDDNAKVLTEKEVDAIFAGEVQNMFILAYHAIGVNFGDFFGSFGRRFGSVIKKATQMADMANTGGSTSPLSQTSN